MTQLKDAIDISESMLKNAEAGNWNNVMEIEHERAQLLEKLFATPNQANNIEVMDRDIHKIININNQLEAMAISARADTGRHIASMNNGRRAVSVYKQHSN